MIGNDSTNSKYNVEEKDIQLNLQDYQKFGSSLMPSLFPIRRNFARTSSCIKLKHMAINDKPNRT